MAVQKVTTQENSGQVAMFDDTDDDENDQKEDKKQDRDSEEDYDPIQDVPRVMIKYPLQDQMAKILNTCCKMDNLVYQLQVYPTDPNNLAEPLLPHQLEAVQKIHALRTRGVNSLLSLNCGRGKTVIALDIIKKHALPT